MEEEEGEWRGRGGEGRGRAGCNEVERRVVKEGERMGKGSEKVSGKREGGRRGGEEMERMVRMKEDNIVG